MNERKLRELRKRHVELVNYNGRLKEASAYVLRMVSAGYNLNDAVLLEALDILEAVLKEGSDGNHARHPGY